jgi:predicted component of type VI protein secretion system
MPTRLVALSEGADIPLDRAMVVVGRHPQCDARLDSIRVSRRHCCMTQDNGEVIVRDLGSTNGIRINGQRVEMGRLRPGDELSIAHLRYRLEVAEGYQEMTLADAREGRERFAGGGPVSPLPVPVAVAMASPAQDVHAPSAISGGLPAGLENPLAAAVRDLLPSDIADRCKIQVIVHMEPEAPHGPEGAPPCPSNSSP